MGNKDHAKFGSPSSLHRTEKCPGWVAYTKDMPAPPPSEHAEEGTYFHEKMEELLPIFIEDPKDSWIKDTLKEVAAKYADMPEVIESTLVRMKRHWDNFCATHTECKLETEVPLVVNDDCYGTGDVVYTGKSKATVKWDTEPYDYKNGAGVMVDAENNLQLIAYMIGAVKRLKIKREELGNVRGVIAQVKFEDGWSEINLSLQELRVWKDKISNIVQLAKDMSHGGTPVVLNPGSHCRWCPADGKCIAQKKACYDEMALTVSEFPTDVETFARKLTLDEQVQVYLKTSQIKGFLDAAALNIQRALEMGEEHPDVKLIRGNGRREWSQDEFYVATRLKAAGVEEPFEKKLIGIGKADDLVGKEVVDELTSKKPGELKVAPATHKSPAVIMGKIEELPSE